MSKRTGICSMCKGPHTGSQVSYCKDCYAAYQRQWRAENPESQKVTHRKNHLKARYSISVKDFEAMMYEQGNCCLICGAEMTMGGRGDRTANVDHDHQTGDVRGLLCALCNSGLGCFGDNPDVLLAAAAYLLRHQPSDLPTVNSHRLTYGGIR